MGLLRMQRDTSGSANAEGKPLWSREQEDKEETIPEHLQCKPCWTSEAYLSATRQSPDPAPGGRLRVLAPDAPRRPLAMCGQRSALRVSLLDVSGDTEQHTPSLNSEATMPSTPLRLGMMTVPSSDSDDCSWGKTPSWSSPSAPRNPGLFQTRTDLSTSHILTPQATGSASRGWRVPFPQGTLSFRERERPVVGGPATHT